VAAAYRAQGTHLVTCAIEHHAVLDSCKRLEKEGLQVTYLPVDREGLVDPGDVAKAITPRTILVSIMQANNEIGTIQPLAEIGRICGSGESSCTVTRCRPWGRSAVRVDELRADLLSITAHKMYGRRGSGPSMCGRGRPGEARRSDGRRGS